tara:strand:+ start:86 stop:964 length:879 start_codon:yes stop_codon:yes gene_type:complete
MKTIKHNKIKNTGILFELLLRQVTADIFASQNKSKAVSLIKEYFNKKTALGKELELYQLLIKNNYNSDQKAEYLINVVTESRKNLSESKLRKEKYNLIKEIKDSFKVKDFFKSRIPNYKVLASIYKVFLSESENINPSDLVTSKCSILEHLTNTPVQSEKKEKIKDKLINEYNKQGKDLRLLSYKILVEKFNKKYSVLSSSQRNLLKEYINNISNTNGLDDYIKNESKKVKSELQSHISSITEKVAKIKVNESLKQIDNLVLGNKKSIEDKIVSLMRYYELNQELNKVHSEK